MAEVENNGACKYAGYIPSENGVSIDRVNLDQISKEDFFRLFVKPRKPAIVTRLQKPMAALQTLWTDEYLIQTAGSALVSVEKRANSSDALFGVVAPKVSMKYRDFVNELKAANDRLYMTTQDPESEEDTATPKLLAEPLLSLQKDFPLQPELLGRLVPYQVSLWQGFARDGASSGLHHDFHDNLYLLLRGKKRFRLFPPSAAVHMSTHGKIDVIYPNGLIVYRRSAKGGKRLSKPYVREDGALKKDVAEAKRDRAECELEAAEDELSKLENGGKEEVRKAMLAKIEKCESDIEAALDELLEYESGDDEEDGNCSETFSDEPSGLDDDEENSDEEDEPQQKKRKAEKQSTVSDIQSNGNKSLEKDLSNIPDHFSKLTLPSDDEAFKNYMAADTTLKDINYLVCELRAGEMLYLPASWLHEVTSYSDQSGQSGHLALNYWVYPPDSDVFDHPYRDDYWHNYWNSVKDSLHAYD